MKIMKQIHRRELLLRHLSNFLPHVTFKKMANLSLNVVEKRYGISTCRSLPPYIKVEPTPLCQLRCPGCGQSEAEYRKEFRGSGHLNLDQFKQIVDPLSGTLLGISLSMRGEPMLNKSIVVAAVEQRPHSAGRVRLEALKRLRFEEDLGPFVSGVIDAHRAIVRTDGYAGYIGLEAAGVHHDRRIQGSDRARSSEILPWAHTVFGNLKTWLRGTFHGVSGKHLQRYLDECAPRRRGKEAIMIA